jgi:predicted DNA binding protein
VNIIVVGETRLKAIIRDAVLASMNQNQTAKRAVKATARVLLRKPSGTRRNYHLLNDEEREALVTSYKAGRSRKALSAAFGVSPATVSNIIMAAKAQRKNGKQGKQG